MQRLDYRQEDFAEQIELLTTRSAFPQEVEEQVAKILRDVRERGDEAIIDYARKFDRVDLKVEEFRVPREEIVAARGAVNAETRRAIELAHANVAAFATERVPKDWEFSPRPGVQVGERFVPLSRIAAYIPGGTAPLVSTTLHTMTMAQVAGVKEIVLLTPVGPDKQVNPAILYAAQLAGATEIYRLGGVYGIAAAAFGTGSIRGVEKIVGPGNAYVTAAKRQVYGHVALDLVAGPSEILIIADETADPAAIAADMLSQAEHGSGLEQCVLVSTCEALIEKVPGELQRQAAALPKQQAVEKVLAQGSFLILVGTIKQAAELASRWAPEHLEIITREPRAVAANITAAGAIFLGPWTPEPVGDFVAGPSHVLPTGGAARFFSGLTVEMFFRRMSLVEYDREALEREGRAIEEFGRIEELAAHGGTVRVRLK